LSQTLISKTPEIIKELLKLDLDYIVRNYNSPVHKFDKKIIKFNNKYPKIAKTLFIPKRQTNQYNAGFVKSHYRIINDKKVWIKKHNRKPRNNT
jgi:hypothetical protein